MKKGNLLFWALASLLWLWTASFGSASEFPTKSIQIIVPYPPGAATDITARIIGPKLSKLLGQAVVVVNKAGGGGTVGIQTVASSKPDGYTLLCTPAGIVIIPYTTPNVGFSLENFVPLNLSTSSPMLIAVKKGSPFGKLEDLIDYAKKNPGKLSYSSAGQGTMVHLVGEMFKTITSTEIVHVPMAGQAGSLTALLGGHVDLAFIEFSPIRAHLEAGDVIGLAVMDNRKIKDFEQISTIVERGLPQAQAFMWFGIFAPAGTPEDIVKKLGDTIQAAFEDQDVIDAIHKIGINVENFNQQKFKSFLSTEQTKWKGVIDRIKERQ